MRPLGLVPAVGLVMLAVGLAVVGFGAYLAYEAYMTYRPLLPAAPSLEKSITNTVYELLNLVIKLGFLGAMIWAGSIILGKGVEVFRGESIKPRKEVRESGEGKAEGGKGKQD